LHALCNLPSLPHSIEHLNQEACMQHTHAALSQKPARNFLLQITAERHLFTIGNKGNGTP